MADIAQLLSDVDACWPEAITLNRLSQETPQAPQFCVLRPVGGCEELGEMMDALVECTDVLPPDELEFHVVRRFFNKAGPSRIAGSSGGPCCPAVVSPVCSAAATAETCTVQLLHAAMLCLQDSAQCCMPNAQHSVISGMMNRSQTAAVHVAAC